MNINWFYLFISIIFSYSYLVIVSCQDFEYKFYETIPADCKGCCQPVLKNNVLANYLAESSHPNYSQLIRSGGRIEYSCSQKNERLFGPKSNVCINGKWIDNNYLPFCDIVCLISEIIGLSKFATCYRSKVSSTSEDKIQIPCDSDFIGPGDEAIIECKIGYEKLIGDSYVRCQSNGEWSSTNFKCRPICGVKPIPFYQNVESDGTTKYAFIDNVLLISAPWNVGIYKINKNIKEYMQICGGTIINTRTIISAKSCFFNEITKKMYPVGLFRIGIGKLFRDLMNADEPRPYQILQISRIHINNDIALGFLSNFIIYQSHVAPICLFNNKMFYTPSESNSLQVKMPVWRFFSYLNSIISMELNLVNFNSTICKVYAQDDLNLLLTDEEYCFESMRNTALTTNNVYSTDIGSGLVFPTISNDQSTSLYVHYLGGIVTNIYLDKNDTQRSLYYSYVIGKGIQFLLDVINAEVNDFCEDYLCSNVVQTCSNYIFLDKTLSTMCEYKNETFPCPIDQLMPVETIVHLSCGIGFSKPINTNNSMWTTQTRCNENGQWSVHPISCIEQCILPKLSDNLIAFYEIKIEDDDNHIESGSLVDEEAMISYECINDDQKWKLIGKTLNVCVNSEWQYEFPYCQRLCSTADLLDPTIITECTYNGFPINCSQELLPYTVAKIVSCNLGYEKPNNFGIYANDEFICDVNGEWNYRIYQCTAICGRETPQGVTYIVRNNENTNNNITMIPWHVGIYYNNSQSSNEYENICGGTILNERLIITAAHCFPNKNIINSNNYRILAGKYYRDFHNLNESLPSQLFTIDSIIIEPSYIGYDNLYKSDIAIIILNERIKFKPWVMPICLKFQWKYIPYKDIIVSPDIFKIPENGQVSGWGLTSTAGSVSNELITIQLPIFNQTICRQNTSQEFHDFITSDKFCGGNTEYGYGVCQGDSGGGLVVLDQDSNNETNQSKELIWYLRGIVSGGHKLNNSCDTFKLSTFTDVNFYIDWINKYLQDYN